MERKTGARGLRSILEDILLDTMFELPAMDGVEEVRYQGHLIKKIERTYAKVMKIFPWVALVFISVAVLVIYNTVKLSIFSRKDLINSLKLIGATRLFIQMPFIFEGLIDGIIATIVSVPLIIGTINGVNLSLIHI